MPSELGWRGPSGFRGTVAKRGGSGPKKKGVAGLGAELARHLSSVAEDKYTEKKGRTEFTTCGVKDHNLSVRARPVLLSFR